MNPRTPVQSKIFVSDFHQSLIISKGSKKDSIEVDIQYEGDIMSQKILTLFLSKEDCVRVADTLLRFTDHEK
jgi:hypothetical protein